MLNRTFILFYTVTLKIIYNLYLLLRYKCNTINIPGMKKLLLSFFCLGLLLAFNEANAQSAPNSMGSGKDEFWGTSKTNKGAATDEVGERGSGLDKRFNSYEHTDRRSAFDKRRIKNSKKMKAIEKKEKEMHKKHRKDKRMLARNRR